jgi:hypothetical protein
MLAVCSRRSRLTPLNRPFLQSSSRGRHHTVARLLEQPPVDRQGHIDRVARAGCLGFERLGTSRHGSCIVGIGSGAPRTLIFQKVGKGGG